MSQHNAPVARRLEAVRYEIRGALARRAHELEADGREIVKLNIGNPGAFGFDTPPHLRAAVLGNLAASDAYAHQQGLAAAREAIAARERARGAAGADAANVFVGNGVSELIDLSLRALLDDGDEVLVPSPDYPLWTASTTLNGARAVHYPCHATAGFVPDPDEVEALVTPRTRALVVISPNNPSGAVYPRETLAALARVAARHRLVLMADEIYDEIVYDDAAYVPLASLAPDVLCLTYGGLSKVHRACGWRVGWVSLSGAIAQAREYRQALELLASMRLCSNVPAQHAIVPALNGDATIRALTSPGGRLFETRAAVIAACRRSEFLSLVPPRGAIYAFPGVDPRRVPGFDDARFALELLECESVLVTPGSGFNVPYRNHFRITLLPEPARVAEVFERIERVVGSMARSRQVA
ncbi:MAG TPA: aminotransferase class I/II-fold pyridoxal phosphate-dependent enzyme [Candidatus Saccharimonadia bacterium]|nr:aminotransferase class I/II-fold pyridoxal phosphate-dependent enzyme [Candidatus Saccharimonadia bacterium]